MPGFEPVCKPQLFQLSYTSTQKTDTIPNCVSAVSIFPSCCLHLSFSGAHLGITRVTKMSKRVSNFDLDVMQTLKIYRMKVYEVRNTATHSECCEKSTERATLWGCSFCTKFNGASDSVDQLWDIFVTVQFSSFVTLFLNRMCIVTNFSNVYGINTSWQCSFERSRHDVKEKLAKKRRNLTW